MSKRKCGCVYADRYNTKAVRDGFEMGGYVKDFCEQHKPKRMQARIDELEQWVAAIADDHHEIPEWIQVEASELLERGAE